jgi:hypothetical protein
MPLRQVAIGLRVDVDPQLRAGFNAAQKAEPERRPLRMSTKKL